MGRDTSRGIDWLNNNTPTRHLSHSVYSLSQLSTTVCEAREMGLVVCPSLHHQPLSVSRNTSLSLLVSRKLPLYISRNLSLSLTLQNFGFVRLKTQVRGSNAEFAVRLKTHPRLQVFCCLLGLIIGFVYDFIWVMCI